MGQNIISGATANEDESRKTRRLINEFLASVEMEKLEAKVNEFNPFKILKLQGHEIRHSNVLAWLLDPNQSHRVGDKFIKKFLSEVMLLNSDKDFPITMFEVRNADLWDADLRREWKNIDILIESQRNKLIVVIENKIDSLEHSEQLTKYADIVMKNYPDDRYRHVFVYLTKQGEQPNNAKDQEVYAVLSYESIYKILKEIVSLYHDRIPRNSLDFINYYIKILGEITLMDKELAELCKKIYRQHSEAIDIIVLNGRITAFVPAAEIFFQAQPALEKSVLTQSAFVFVPLKMKIDPLLVTVNKKYNTDAFPIQFYFIVTGNKLKFVLEVTPFTDSKLRVQFMEYLRQNSADMFKITNKASQVDTRNTILYSASKEISDWDNEESIADVMLNAYTEAKDKEDRIIKDAQAFFGTLPKP